MNEEQSQINLTIAKGSSIVFVGMVLAKLVNLPTSIILARYFGADKYGLLTIGGTLIGIVASVSVLGMGMGLGRYIPFHQERGEVGQLKRILEFSVKTVLGASMVATVLVFLSAELIAVRIFHDENLVPLIRIFSVSIPMLALIQYGTGLFRGLKKLHYILYYSDFLAPVLRLLFLIIIVFFGLGILHVAASQVLVALITLLLVLVLFKRDELFDELRARKASGNVAQFFKYSLPLAIAIIVRFARRRFDLLLVGALLAARDVGVYNVAMSLALLLNVPLLGINRILLPVASGLLSMNKVDQLTTTYKSVSRWCLLAVLPFLLFVLFFAEEIISFLYGPEFIFGADPLRIIAVAISFNAATGSFGEYLQVFGKSRAVMLISVIGSVANIIGLVFLVPKYGILGAAASFLLSMAMMVVIGICMLIPHKIHPFSRQYFVGFFVGILLYYPLFTIAKLLITGSIVSMIILFPLSLVLYVALLFLFNIFPPGEKEMILQIMRKLFLIKKKHDVTHTL